MQFTGRVIIKEDGKTHKTISGASLDPGGVTRTPVPLDNGEVGYTEAVRQSMVEATIVDDADAAWYDALKGTNVVLIFETDTGVSWKIAPATSTGEAKMSEGKAPVAWFGPPAKKL